MEARHSVCHACREPSEKRSAIDGNLYCHDCFDELAHGIIPPAYGPLEDETGYADYQNLVDQGSWDNSVRALEDSAN